MLLMKNFGSNGRFGNQIFQYLLLYSLSKKDSLNFYIPKVTNFDKYFETSKLSYINIDLFDSIINKEFIESDKECYSKKEFVIQKKNYNFNGYFQNINYFIGDIDNILQEELVFKKDLIDSSKNYLKSCGIDYNRTCAIHVRRTDYVHHHNVFCQLSKIGYYDVAMSRVSKLDKKIKFCVFSDDISNVRKEFSTLPYNISFIDNDSEFINFISMKLCKYKIIANSTFSLCAALLNHDWYKHKVFYPKQWLKNTLLNPLDDVNPLEWTAI